MKRHIAPALLLGILIGATAVAAEKENITVALIGDSTVTDAAGWGKAFAQRFGPSATVLNFAVGGRSSKSWYDEKRLPAVLGAEPDYVLIQFGHNGQPGKGPKRETDPATSYREFLRMYVREFRKIGAQPVLVSSVTRRRFTPDGKLWTTLTPWAKAAAAVAKELKVPFVDLHTASVAYHNKIGPEASMAFNPKEGDLSHFNEKGAAVIAEMIVEDLKKVVPGLAEHLK